jgi:hypothetical protein
VAGQKVIAIYAPNISPRLSYTVATLFGNEALVSANKLTFLQHDGPRINYSHEFLDVRNLWIHPHGLLEESGIAAQEIELIQWKGFAAFFKTSDGTIPFDVFAAAFYLLSRYEEYLSHEKDKYGRFPAEASLAFKARFLQQPLIQCWIKALGWELRLLFPDFRLQAIPFQFIPTYDIDLAFAYLNQPLTKQVVGFFKTLYQGKFEAFLEMAKVLSGNAADPSDQFQQLQTLHQELLLQPHYFFLLAAKRLGVDKNIAPSNQALQSIIQALSKQYPIGIHPSWQSGDEPALLLSEINCLSKIIDKPINTSRQHYLRMQFPQTYERLLAAGIQDDYTMGYASQNGFRASYAGSFYWYNLTRECKTNLLIHPFCYMDATAIFYKREPVYEAAKELHELTDMVIQYGGEMMAIFHNDFLTQQPEWIEWSQLHEDWLRKYATTSS